MEQLNIDLVDKYFLDLKTGSPQEQSIRNRIHRYKTKRKWTEYLSMKAAYDQYKLFIVLEK